MERQTRTEAASHAANEAHKAHAFTKKGGSHE